MADLLPFVRRSHPVWACFDVQQTIGDALASLAPRLRRQRIQVDVDVLPGTSWIADRDLVRQALVQMLTNAADAMPDGGELEVTVWSGPSRLELEVADSGPGLEASGPGLEASGPGLEASGPGLEASGSQADGKAGEPSASDEVPNAKLSLVRRVAEAHGGRMLAANCPQGGAAYTLVLPRPAMRAAA